MIFVFNLFASQTEMCQNERQPMTDDIYHFV